MRAVPQALTIHIERDGGEEPTDQFSGGKRTYRALAENGATIGRATFPWPALQEWMNAWTDPVPSRALQKCIGDALKDFLTTLLQNSVDSWPTMEEKLLQADSAGRSIVLELRLGAVELFAIPWELSTMSDGRPLGQLPSCVIQYEWVSTSPPREPGPTGRVLYAWAQPVEPVPVHEHRNAIKRSVTAFNPDPKRDELPYATLQGIRDRLQQAENDRAPFRVLHLLCHGVRVTKNEFGLKLHPADPHEPPHHVTGSELRAALTSFGASLDCVVLSACHGANAGAPGEMFGGVAHELHRQGIPTVIASRMPLSDEGSEKFAAAFYQALYRDQRTMNEAFRTARLAAGADWATLQLLRSNRPARAAPRARRVLFGPSGRLPRLDPAGVAAALEINLEVASASVLHALAGRLGDTLSLPVLQPLGRVAPELPLYDEEWNRSFAEVDRFADALTARIARDGAQSLHLFGIAPLPLMFWLGWRLQRQPTLQIYQQHHGWGDAWSLGYSSTLTADDVPFFDVHWPDPDQVAQAERLAVTIEVRHRATNEQLAKWLGTEGQGAVLRLVARPQPSATAVRDPFDAARALKQLQQSLDQVPERYPSAREIWLGIAGPASLAAALGRAWRPNVHGRLVLFNFRKGEGYTRVHPLDGSRNSA